MPKYERNHYVPKWYQYLFFEGLEKENSFYYLDLKPDSICCSNGKKYNLKAMLRWGPLRCFCEKNLYQIRLKNFNTTEIEENFFGAIDASGKIGVEYFNNLKRPDKGIHEAFNALLPYLSVQKLRTPKGLSYLSSIIQSDDKNLILKTMINYHEMHCALWAESIWCIADIGESATKFIISDHPVTVYNQDCFPGSKMCRGFNDPEIWLNGTYTIFPLSINRILILTNLSWLRNPYADPLKCRPNPKLFRSAVFDFSSIQTRRILNESEVIAINYVIKQRAYKYIASAKEDWLYPEERIDFRRWDEIGLRFILMPDPRSIPFRNNTFFGYENGFVDASDAYGRKPWENEYKDGKPDEFEWHTFQAFIGEYARIFGAKRRGVGFDYRKKELEDDPEYHKDNLRLEQFHKAYFKRPRSKNYNKKMRRK